jgi:predicted alpha/beta-fold hydrolase
MSGGHFQTLLPALWPPVSANSSWLWEEETLELRDGDFLQLAWLKRRNSRVAILCHGLEGTFEAGYIRGMAMALCPRGWDCLAWNFRGCGANTNRLPRFYHSGATDDLDCVVLRALPSYEHVALVGFSLGGNLLLKYLCEAPRPSEIRCAAAISAPIDVAGTADALDRKASNQVYRRRFLKTLRSKIRAKTTRFPEILSSEGIECVTTFREFDGRYTAALHGFDSAEHYWQESSACHILENLRVPALLLNARNDPLLTPDCFPVDLANEHPYLWLEAPESGGHVGFIQSLWNRAPWSEWRVPEFLEAHSR